jgi:recombination protein RecT
MTARPSVREQAAAAANGQPSTDVDRRTQGPTLADRMDQLAPAFQKAMPVGLEARQLIRDTLACARTNTDLLKCEPHSVLGAAMTCAQLGLRPGVLGQAYIVPFWNSRNSRHEATFIPGYQGLIQLMYRHPAVSRVIARPILDGDEWAIEYGYDERLVHKPKPDGEPGRGLIAAYTVARLANGGGTFLHMNLAELNWWRDQYAKKNKEGHFTGPWGKREGSQELLGMRLKTTTRRIARSVPMSIELVSALAADGGVRTETDPDAAPEQVTVFVDGPPQGVDPATGEIEAVQERQA